MSGHDGHRKSKVSEENGFRTIRCVDCKVIYTVEIDRAGKGP